MAQVCRNLILSCFCCDGFPTCSWLLRSTFTKTAYLLIFFTSFLLFSIVPYTPTITKSLPFCKGNYSSLCSLHPNYPAVYRISFTYAIFYVFMCFFTFGITSSRSFRSGLHSGFWLPKITFIVFLLVLSCYIPHGLFDVVLFYFGMIFIVTFTVFEMFLFMRLSKTFTFFFITFCWRRAPGCTKFFVSFSALVFLFADTAIFYVLFFFYSNCTFNFTIILINIIISLLVNFGSTCLRLQRRDWNSFLGGSVLTTHVMFRTWSALSNNPRQNCNPPKDYITILFVVNNMISLSTAIATIFLALEYFIQNVPRDRPNGVTYLEERGRECCGIWGKTKLIEVTQPPDLTIPPDGITYKSTDPKDDEYDQVKYHWYAMHNIYLQGIFYLMICLTNNYKYAQTFGDYMFQNEDALWFKLVSCWLCIFGFTVLDFIPDSTRFHLVVRQ